MNFNQQNLRPLVEINPYAARATRSPMPVWLPILTILPALLLPLPLISFYRDAYSRRPGAIPVSFLLVPLCGCLDEQLIAPRLVPSGIATVGSILASSEEYFLDSMTGKINLLAWLIVVGPLSIYLLSVGFSNLIAIMMNPLVPKERKRN